MLINIAAFLSIRVGMQFEIEMYYTQYIIWKIASNKNKDQ